MSYENYIRFFCFREERVRNGSKKLSKARTISQQGRLDSFFSVTRKVKTTTKTSPVKKVVTFQMILGKYNILSILGKSNCTKSNVET